MARPSRSSTPTLCGRFHARVLEGVTIGPSPALDRQPAARARHAPDQPRRRRLELRDARARPAHPHLRPRPAGHRRDGRAALRVRCARDGESLVTLDDVERALSTADGVIADADDVAGRSGRRHGWRVAPRSPTPPRRSCSSWRGADPMTIARTSKRLNLRSEASARFERGPTPRSSTLAARRFAELLAPAGARLTSERRRRARLAAATGHRSVCAPLASTRCSAPTSTGPQITGLLRPIGFHLAPAGDDTGAEQDVDGPQLPPGHDDRDRRDRGDRPPLRLRQHRRVRCRSPCGPARSPSVSVTGVGSAT